MWRSISSATTTDTISNWYAFIFPGVNTDIRLGVKKLENRGADEGKRVMEKTKTALHSIMYH